MQGCSSMPTPNHHCCRSPPARTPRRLGLKSVNKKMLCFPLLLDAAGVLSAGARHAWHTRTMIGGWWHRGHFPAWQAIPMVYLSPSKRTADGKFIFF